MKGFSYLSTSVVSMVYNSLNQNSRFTILLPTTQVMGVERWVGWECETISLNHTVMTEYHSKNAKQKAFWLIY